MEIPLTVPSQLTLALAATQVESKPMPIRFKSPLRYPGGKQKAIDQIAAAMPSSAGEFREPLVGGGSVYFHARTSNFAEKYWINDAFKELISFWSIVQNEKTCARLVKDLEELRDKFKSAEQSKEFFLQAREERTRSKYREALLFFFFNRVTFSGTTRAGGFSAAASQTRFTQSSIDRLLPMPEALLNTNITNLDFGEVVEAPGDDVFLFLDPPYWTATKLYGRDGDLHAFDHWKLAKLLKKTKHRFLITYDDCEEIRNLYSWANINEWTLQYGMNNCSADRKSRIGSELLIKNY
ncbi:MAG: DNA adenine methylase [Candidatus Obscuribacterales bacterium]|nr:DNA adenine methylase [Candidatus Obscuribacterales bacterium]